MQPNINQYPCAEDDYKNPSPDRNRHPNPNSNPDTNSAGAHVGRKDVEYPVGCLLSHKRRSE